jgi:nucleolin
MASTQQNDIQTKIISELESSKSSSSSSSMDVKKLRKIILLQLQTDSDDKSAKKQYKKAVKALEADGKINLDGDGKMTLVGGTSSSKKKKKDKKDKKKKKRKNSDDDDESSNKKQKANDDENGNENDNENGNDDDNNKEDGDNIEKEGKSEEKKQKEEANNAKDKNRPCKGNPLGVTRLFLGNLPFAVDEASLNDYMSPAVITHIKWITDKETGKFYGSAFIEMRTSKDSAIAVTEKNGNKLMGRPLKINYAPSREGDIWPPKSKEITGNGGQAGGSGVKAMSEKPENCVKLFIGNLSFDIDDDAMVKFFANVDAELKAVRWLHHKDSGDFKGCGYAEFWNTEACEKAATLNGKTLMGRPIRIDWTD